MKLSGHEINSQLRQKLEMPTGRHLYVVLGTYERLERYERVDFREARSPDGQRLGEPVNVNRQPARSDHRRGTQAAGPDGSQPDRERQGSAIQGTRCPRGREAQLQGSFLALKNLEILFAYDLELNCLRIRAMNQKHILILLPGERVGDRITLFHEAPRTTIGPCPPTWSQRIICGS